MSPTTAIPLLGIFNGIILDIILRILSFRILEYVFVCGCILQYVIIYYRRAEGVLEDTPRCRAEHVEESAARQLPRHVFAWLNSPWMAAGWRLAGWLDGWLPGWLAGWMDGWMDGWTSGCMHACISYMFGSCWLANSWCSKVQCITNPVVLLITGGVVPY